MNNWLLCFLLLVGTSCYGQTSDETVIRNILNNQSQAWNKGDYVGFMQGYWKSDSLMFIGKDGITYGWEKTLSSYKKNYPDTAAMGKLHFDIILVKSLSPEYYSLTGRWNLKRITGNLTGYFTLLFRKINGSWVIIADHSS
jgi:hypothetical protein